MNRLLIVALLASLVLAACSDMPVRTVDDAIAAEESAIIATPVRNAVDVIWVVDNSNSMRPFQLRLARDLPALASALAELNVDFNFAVTTVWRDDTGFRDRPDPRELDSRFRPDGFRERCEEPRGPVLRAVDYRDNRGIVDIDALQSDFECLSAVGEEPNAATEMGLQVVQRRIIEEFQGNDPVGFLRDDALLVVIFLSDEDDCSQEQLRITSNACYQRTNYFDLTDVGEIERTLLEAKGANFEDPASVQAARDRVLVLGLIGPPIVGGVYKPTLIGPVSENAATTCSGVFTGLPGLPDSCSVAADCGVSGGILQYVCQNSECGLVVTANSSYRYWDLMRRFVPSYRPPGAEPEESGSASEGEETPAAPEGVDIWENDPIGFIPPPSEQPWRPICAADYSPVLRALARQITSVLELNCLPSRPRGCETNADCSAGAQCILSTNPQFGGCPAQNLCTDFRIQVELLEDEPRRARGSITAGEYCANFDSNRETTGGYIPAEDAEFYVDFRALRCPYGAGFNFTQGNQPADDVQFRLRYPVSISDDF
ncbi:MAG: hypothetical protein EA398_08385 [Deltaproteobacteria bacterium]|nr:MAG: hypothetical protein EA398_08385 [Deltaproteobacteria bacterium]